MDDNAALIFEEKVNLLRGPFCHLPEQLIRDVLRRPDVDGDVELASENLGSLMEFGDLHGGSIETAQSDSSYSHEYADTQEWFPSEGSDEGSVGHNDSSEEENGEYDNENREEHLTQDKIQETCRGVSHEVTDSNENERNSVKDRLKQYENYFGEKKPYGPKSDGGEKSESRGRSLSLVERGNEKEQNLRGKERDIFNNKRNSSLVDLEFADRGNTTKGLSDSDDDVDIEKYFETNFGRSEGGFTEMKERKSETSAPVRLDEIVHNSTKVDKAPAAVKHPVHGRFVADAASGATVSGEDTSPRRYVPASLKEETRTELNHKKSLPQSNRVVPSVPQSNRVVPSIPQSSRVLPSVPPKQKSCDEPEKPDLSHSKGQDSDSAKKTKSRKRNRRSTKQKLTRQVTPCQRQRSVSKDEACSDEDQSGSLGNQGSVQRVESSYCPKAIIVTGLNEKTTADALSNYMELMTGEDVEKVTFLGEGKAVVYTSQTPGDFEKVVAKVNSRTLDGMQLSVERIKACDSILVSDLSPQITKDTILLYFENARRSGGGDVKAVEISGDHQSAVVIFEDIQVIEQVLSKEHTLEGKQLFVEKHFPQLSSKRVHNDSSVATPPPKVETGTNKPEQPTKHDPPPDRQNVDVEVDSDIMQFIMTGNHRRDLEEKLSGFKAEIEWITGSDSVKIWKKASSGYIKKWTNNCQSTVYEFLDRFEKFSVPLEDLVAPAIKGALPRVKGKVPGKKALCKGHDSRKELVVVCLEDEKEIVSKAISEFLEVIKKEEVRKTFKKETVKNIDRDRLLLLEKMEFSEELKRKHSDLEVILDKEKGELYLEGPREQFTSAKIRYLHTMNAIVDGTYSFQSAIFSVIMKNEPGRRYFQQKLAEQNITAMFFPRENNPVKIVAASSTALQKAKECLDKSMKQDTVTFQDDEAFIFEIEKCKKLFKDLQADQLLEICTAKLGRSVALYGVDKAVKNAKRSIEALIEAERIGDDNRQIESSALIRFLDVYCSQKLKDLERKWPSCHVSITINTSTNCLVISGTREGRRKCNSFLDDFLRTIVAERKQYSSPGMSKLLLGDTGRRNVKLIENEKKVIIEIRKKMKDGVRNTVQSEVDLIQREEKSLLEEKIKLRESAQGSAQTTGCVYDMCNFTTAEGLRVSWKIGSIEHETADILVNSATSDLNKPTACGRALLKVGRSRFAEACQPHTHIPAGDIVCTVGGRLNCQYVIHAVCCHWNPGRNGSEQVLRGLVNKILSKCNEIGATSLAMPTIGTGQHGFPESVVATAYRDEIQRFSTANRYQMTLSEIRIIVYKASSPSAPAAMGSQDIFQMMSSFVRQFVANPPVVSLGSVRVLLDEGDITQQPSVDAIINVLPSNSQLSNGGGVCKSIIQAGGQTIQQQLNNIGSKQSGSVFSTNSGAMSHTQHILHFIPMSSNVPDLQSAMELCFNEAKLLGFTSVSTPAIGTASFGVTPRSSAELILKAAENFSISNNYALEVHVVVFQKNMVADFETVLRERASGHVQAQPSPPTTQVTTPKLGKPLQRRSTITTLKTGAAKEVVELELFAISQQDIDASFEEVDKFVKANIVRKKIEHEKAFIAFVNYWSTVEKLARDHDVSITCTKSSSIADIEGMTTSVSDCKDELLQLINSHAEEERRSTQVEFISKNVQWYYFQGGQSFRYDKELNATIEMAYMENRDTFQINKNGDTCDINLIAKTEKNRRSGQVETITRKQMGESQSDISVPSHWSKQPSSQVVQLVTLQPSSSEYRQVLNHFTTRGGTGIQIIKIERIQNPGLYKAYLVKKQSMNGAENEKQLFHGTKTDNTVSINANNFSRSYAGINGTMYGNGVYFARDASYSLRYAKSGINAYRQMYVARVLVGLYTTGRHGMKAPPSKNDPNNPGLLYDSLVDNPSNPSLFVIFMDHQCYPEYLITFQ